MSDKPIHNYNDLGLSSLVFVDKNDTLKKIIEPINLEPPKYNSPSPQILSINTVNRTISALLLIHQPSRQMIAI